MEDSMSGSLSWACRQRLIQFPSCLAAPAFPDNTTIGKARVTIRGCEVGQAACRGFDPCDTSRKFSAVASRGQQELPAHRSRTEPDRAGRGRGVRTRFKPDHAATALWFERA